MLKFSIEGPHIRTLTQPGQGPLPSFRWFASSLAAFMINRYNLGVLVKHLPETESAPLSGSTIYGKIGRKYASIYSCESAFRFLTTVTTESGPWIPE